MLPMLMLYSFIRSSVVAKSIIANVVLKRNAEVGEFPCGDQKCTTGLQGGRRGTKGKKGIESRMEELENGMQTIMTE